MSRKGKKMVQKETNKEERKEVHFASVRPPAVAFDLRVIKNGKNFRKLSQLLFNCGRISARASDRFLSHAGDYRR